MFLCLYLFYVCLGVCDEICTHLLEDIVCVVPVPVFVHVNGNGMSECSHVHSLTHARTHTDKRKSQCFQCAEL